MHVKSNKIILNEFSPTPNTQHCKQWGLSGRDGSWHGCENDENYEVRNRKGTESGLVSSRDGRIRNEFGFRSTAEAVSDYHWCDAFPFPSPSSGFIHIKNILVFQLFHIDCIRAPLKRGKYCIRSFSSSSIHPRECIRKSFTVDREVLTVLKSMPLT